MKNRGITLVELIISISLISIVVLFLFRLLVDVKYNDNKTDFARANQQNRAIIIKTVQDDFLDYGLINLTAQGNANELKIMFSYEDNKQGTLTVHAHDIAYQKANGEIEKWLLDSSIGTYKVQCVRFIKNGFNDQGDFFSVWFRIPLEVKKESKNVLDDLEFFYIGKKIDLQDGNAFSSNYSLGNYNPSSC